MTEIDRTTAIKYTEFFSRLTTEERYGEMHMRTKNADLLGVGIAELMATVTRLERQIAAGEQKDDEYAALVEGHVRNDILCENITEAVEDDEPDRQTPGQRKWHLYFDGLYNEMPY